MSSTARILVPVAAVALVAGGVGAGGVAALSGSGSETRTVTVEAAAAPVKSPNQAVAATTPAPAAATAVTALPLPSGAALDAAAIYREAGPAVVRIDRVEQTAAGATGGLGSGFVIDADGYIVTNAHVVDGAGDLYVNFSDDSRVRATLVGEDLATDIALIKVDVPASGLHPVPLGDSSQVQVGEPVVAIGNPFGFDRTVTSGIVSAVSRMIDSPNGMTTIPGAIQTDAAINHGNSGGPLLNARGEVIGINSQINTGGTGDGNVGIGFAVPIDLVKSVVAQLRESGIAKHAWLGVSLSQVDPTLAEKVKLPVTSGVMVASVADGGPAAAAGLEAATDEIMLDGQSYSVGGDVIVKLGDTPVADQEDIREAMLQLKPGDTVPVEVVRADGSRTTLQVTMGDLSTEQAKQAAAAQQQAPQEQTPQETPQIPDPFAP